jgi:hypothetical protein
MFPSGLLDLYEASGKEYYLLQAIRLQETQDRLFWDEKNGGYFTSVEDEYILIRQKDNQVCRAQPLAVLVHALTNKPAGIPFSHRTEPSLRRSLSRSPTYLDYLILIVRTESCT